MEHDIGLDWQLLDNSMHAGVQRLLSDLNHLYAAYGTARVGLRVGRIRMDRLHDTSKASFHTSDAARTRSVCVIVCNFTPVVRHNYRIGVSRAAISERVNTDSGRMRQRWKFRWQRC